MYGTKSDNLYKQLPTPFVFTMSGNDYHFNQQFSDSFAHLLTATNPLHLDIYQYSSLRPQHSLPKRKYAQVI